MARPSPSNRQATGPDTPGSSGVGDGPDHAASLFSAVDLIASFVAAFEPARYSGEDAASLVSCFARAERLCGTGKSLAATRATDTHRPEAAGHPSPAHWLSDLTGESIGEAADALRLGEALGSHPGMEEACREGRLSRSKAKLVADAVGANPGSEDELVRAAETDTMRQLRDRCLRAKAQARSAADARRHHEEMHRSRHCRTWTDRDGAFRLDARLTPDAGAVLLSSLEAQSNLIFGQARKEGRHEPADAYRADALVALVSGQALISKGTARRGSPAGRSGDSDRGDGNTGDSDTRDGDTGDGPASPAGPGARATVHLRVDLDALRRGSLSDGELCEIPGVGPVSIDTARELMGDAITQLVITDGVDVTTICHLGRSIPSPLRTALVERDQACVVPGCDVRQGLEIDHWAVSFADGGPASLENLARLCGHHHYLRTHRGFQLLGGPGHWRWRTPKPDRPPAATSTQPTEASPTLTAGSVRSRDPNDASDQLPLRE